jgi:hypothetical protein
LITGADLLKPEPKPSYWTIYPIRERGRMYNK